MRQVKHITRNARQSPAWFARSCAIGAIWRIWLNDQATCTLRRLSNSSRKDSRNDCTAAGLGYQKVIYNTLCMGGGAAVILRYYLIYPYQIWWAYKEIIGVEYCWFKISYFLSCCSSFKLRVASLVYLKMTYTTLICANVSPRLFSYPAPNFGWV